jgi:hypothetical protein
MCPPADEAQVPALEDTLSAAGRMPAPSAAEPRENSAIDRSATIGSTCRGAARRRSTPKQLLGRLPSAILLKVGELYIRATSRAAWSGVHQGGGNAERGRRVRIPARPFLWLSDGACAPRATSSAPTS